MALLSGLAHRIAAIPWCCDLVQMLVGLKQAQQRLACHVADAHHKTVLDVGAGTGLYRQVLPETAEYIWLDMDPVKLGGFRRRRMTYRAMLLADATRLCLRDRSVDLALCISVAHHLSDEALARLLSEMARVVREKAVFLEPLDRPDSAVSRLLWRCDRGSWPRSAAVLLNAIQVDFAVEHAAQYRVYHRYLLCIARPRSDGSQPQVPGTTEKDCHCPPTH